MAETHEQKVFDVCKTLIPRLKRSDHPVKEILVPIFIKENRQRKSKGKRIIRYQTIRKTYQKFCRELNVPQASSHKKRQWSRTNDWRIPAKMWEQQGTKNQKSKKKTLKKSTTPKTRMSKDIVDIVDVLKNNPDLVAKFKQIICIDIFDQIKNCWDDGNKEKGLTIIDGLNKKQLKEYFIRMLG